jgi:hypothetical protein
LNSSGIEQPKQSQADQAATANTGYGKAGKQSALSNFPTATTTTNYNQYGIRILRARSKHQKINGVEISVYIPYADKLDKEFHFIGYFYPDTTPSQPQKASDNVKAMCDAHKLSPELEKQYCVEQPPVAASIPAPPSPADATGQYSPNDLQTAANLAALSCAQIKTLILSNSQMATYLPYTWKTAQARCKQ